MSPKFYSSLWVLYFVCAGIMWLAGVLTMFAIVVFGFIALGMTFMGMMCVLPGTVSHTMPEEVKMPQPEKAAKQSPAGPVTAATGFSAYRSL